MPQKKYITGIIGTGKVASALAAKLNPGNLSFVFSRSRESTERMISSAGISLDKFIYDYDDIKKLPGIIILAVTDSSIIEISKKMADEFRGSLEGKYVFHTSGFKSREELDVLESYGAKTASVHPYQTFYKPAPGILKGIGWGIDCRKNDFAFIRDFIIFLDGHAVNLSGLSNEQKILYHSSAVSASNYLTMVIASAQEIAKKAGVKSGEFLPPIIETTVKNNLANIEKGENVPLTGPIARGDSEALKMHLHAMEKFPEMKRIYSAAGIATAEMAYSNKLLDYKQYKAVIDILKENI